MSSTPIENGTKYYPNYQQDLTLGLTPLIEATILNRPDIMLEYIADAEMVNEADELGNMPLHYAVDTGFTQGVHLLTSQECQMERFNMDNLSPLMLALERHHIGIAEMLIDRGASPYSLNSKHESALNMAIEMRQIELVELMLEQNDDPQIKLPSLYSACSKAAKYNRIEYIDLLINAGADLNIEFYVIDPPLNISAGYGNPEMVKAWLKYGAPIERYDLKGFTPLMEASSAGQLEACEILVSYVYASFYWESLNGAANSTNRFDCPSNELL
ncbi:hypothetical protein ACTXT7_014187 [Hymenolepis weldensis]